MLTPVDIDMFQRDQQKMEILSNELGDIQKTLSHIQAKLIKDRMDLQ